MNLKVNDKHIVIFDLDDTLYKEINFLKSAFRAISERLYPQTGSHLYEEMFSLYKSGKEVFGNILQEYNIYSLSKEELIDQYRSHKPNIKLLPDAKDRLLEIKDLAFALCLMTDGRGYTQRNKLDSLGIKNLFDEILISREFGSSKPAKENYLFFEGKYPSKKFTYIGDNITKDFITANHYGWRTICLLDNGLNIHSQEIEVKEEYLPNYYISSYWELSIIS